MTTSYAGDLPLWVLLRLWDDDAMYNAINTINN